MSKGAPLAETVKALQEIDRVIDLIECPGSSAAQNIAVIKLIWSEVKRARAALPLIRAQVLEEAAVTAEEWAYAGTTSNIAAGIRALKEQP